MCGIFAAVNGGKVTNGLPEGIAGIPTDTDIASEFRYRGTPADAASRALLISRSGETVDTLAALQYARARGQSCYAIVNQAKSSVAKESDALLQTLAGVETGVASTKAFTAQPAVLPVLALYLARTNGRIDEHEEQRLLKALTGLPQQTSDLLQDDAMPALNAAANVLQHASTIHTPGAASLIHRPRRGHSS